MASQPTPNPPQAAGDHAPPERPSRGLIAIRVLAPLAVVASAVGGLTMFVVLLAGSRHASDPGAGFGFALLAIAAVTLLGPLAVFAPRHWQSHQIWHGLGTLTTVLALAVSMPAIWDYLIAPPIQSRIHTRGYERAFSALEVVDVQRQPLELEGLHVGERTRVSVRISRDLPVDRYSREVPQLLRSWRLDAGKLHGPPFDFSTKVIEATFDGQPVDLSKLTAASGPPGTPAAIRAGLYTVTFDQWRWGLDGSHGPCRRPLTALPAADARWASVREVPVKATSEVEVTLGPVSGRWRHKLGSAAFDYPYDHEAWTRQLAASSIEPCDDRAQRLRREEEAAQAAKAQARERQQTEDYLAGRVPWQTNPLRTAACAHDATKLRDVLAKGTPRYPYARVMTECKVTPEQADAFALLMQAMHAQRADRASHATQGNQDDGGDDYCKAVGSMLENRDITALRRLVSLGLPPVCPGPAHHAALLHNPNNTWLAPDDRIAWLEDAARAGIVLCKPAPGGHTLLQQAVLRESLPVIEFLLDRGCDPSVMPSTSLSPDGRLQPSARLAWHLRATGLARLPGMDKEPITPDEARRARKRIPAPDPAELRRVDPRTGASGPLLFTGPYGGWSLSIEPRLLTWLATQGARFDVADENGRSWYHDGYRLRGGDWMKGHERLDALTPAQLRQMLEPVNLASRKPGIALDAVQDMEPGGLGHYLCGRGVIACTGSYPR